MEAPVAERRDRPVVLRRLVRAGLEVPRVGVARVQAARSVAPSRRSSPASSSVGCAERARRMRVEPVLEHEQLEVAARAVERRRRSRTGASRRRAPPRRGARRRGRDRRPQCAQTWRAGVPASPRRPPRRSSQRSIVPCAAAIRPAASARRSSARAALASRRERGRPRRRRRSPAQRGRGAHRVAREPRLPRDLARVAEHGEHAARRGRRRDGSRRRASRARAVPGRGRPRASARSGRRRRRRSPRASTSARCSPPAPEQNILTPCSRAVARCARARPRPARGRRPRRRAAAVLGDRGQLALAQRLLRVHGEPLDRVEVAVEDPPDGAVGPRDGAHQRPLGRGDRQPASSDAGLARERRWRRAGNAAAARGRAPPRPRRSRRARPRTASGQRHRRAPRRCRSPTGTHRQARSSPRRWPRERRRRSATVSRAAVAPGAGPEPVVGEHDAAVAQLAADRGEHRRRRGRRASRACRRPSPTICSPRVGGELRRPRRGASPRHAPPRRPHAEAVQARERRVGVAVDRSSRSCSGVARDGRRRAARTSWPSASARATRPGSPRRPCSPSTKNVARAPAAASASSTAAVQRGSRPVVERQGDFHGSRLAPDGGRASPQVARERVSPLRRPASAPRRRRTHRRPASRASCGTRSCSRGTGSRSGPTRGGSTGCRPRARPRPSRCPPAATTLYASMTSAPDLEPGQVLALHPRELVQDVVRLHLEHGEDRAGVRVRPVEHEQIGEAGHGDAAVRVRTVVPRAARGRGRRGRPRR